VQFHSFTYVIPEGWATREEEDSGITVLTPIQLPDTVIFRPTLVISCSDLQGRSTEDLLRQTQEALGSTLDRVEEVGGSEQFDTGGALSGWSFTYAIGDTRIRVDQFLTVDGDTCLVGTATYAESDRAEFGQPLADVASSMALASSSDLNN
jgi:hypothetical protein